MNGEFIGAPTFSFAARPSPVPGDLRISWRLAVIILMLAASRGRRASLVKLHILNDAVRSASSAELLDHILGQRLSPLNWRMRVEPAFARAIDLLVGNRLAEWYGKDERRGLKLTAAGTAAADQIALLEDALAREKSVVAKFSKSVTEEWAQSLASARGLHSAQD